MKNSSSGSTANLSDKINKLDKMSQFFYPDWDLEPKLISELERIIIDRLDAEGVSEPRRSVIISALFKSLSGRQPTHPLPQNAPELYKERVKKKDIGRKENALEFLERVYAKWVYGNGLFRGHILEWDKPLYTALYKIRNDISDFDTLLPTSQGRTYEDLSLTDSQLLDRRRNTNNRRNRPRR